MNVKKICKVACISAIASMSLQALSLKDSVEKVMVSNPEVIAEKKNQEAFRYYIDERRANYYPRLDIDGSLEKSNSEKDYDKETTSQADGSSQEDGYNFGIAINQILYDGDLTPSLVREAKHNYKANVYRTDRNIDNVVLETIRAYYGFVQYNEMLGLTKDMISTNEDNLAIAKEKEDISGEVLETYQVKSKLNFINEKYLEEEDLKNSKISAFKRYIGVKPDGTECRVNIDLSKIPSNLQEALELAVLKNNEILEQIERIKAQREKIAQRDATFLPNLNLELKALTDNDLSLNENGIENQVFGRITMAWNLYNGGRDYAVSKQEEKFLSEQKIRLNSITNKIVESIKVSYERFAKNKQRLDSLKKYVNSNENIVEVYKSEFEAGTRTFVDILDAQTTLYEARKALLNREFEYYYNYYELLNSFSILSQTVLNFESTDCSQSLANEEIFAPAKKEKVDSSNELNALLGDNNSNEEISLPDEPKTQVQKNSSSNNSFLNAPVKSYTLNLKTTNGLNAANSFVRENGLSKNDSFVYEFGPNMKSAKVIYGIFSSVQEAKKALNSLPASVLKYQPYIDNMSKHKNLYAKYH